MIYYSLKEIADTLGIKPCAVQKILDRNPAFVEFKKTRVPTGKYNAFTYPATCIAFFREYLASREKASGRKPAKEEKPAPVAKPVVYKKHKAVVKEKTNTVKREVAEAKSTFLLVDDFTVKIFLDNERFSVTLSRTEKYSISFDSEMNLKIKNTAISIGIRIGPGHSVCYEKKSNQYVDSEGMHLSVAEEYGSIANEGKLIDFFRKYLNVVK